MISKFLDKPVLLHFSVKFYKIISKADTSSCLSVAYRIDIFLTFKKIEKLDIKKFHQDHSYIDIRHTTWKIKKC